MLQLSGQGTLLAKTDLRSAVCMLSIYPYDFDVISAVTKTTMTNIWLLNKTSTFLHMLLCKASNIHYLDDVLFAGKPGDSSC